MSSSNSSKELAACIEVLIENLHQDVTEGVLHQTISFMATVVSITVCRDKDTGLSKGCAFITFWSIGEAERVQKVFNNVELMGQKMKISFPSRKPFEEGDHNILVSNIHPAITNVILQKSFQNFGRIKSCLLILNAEGSSRGTAIISYYKEEAAKEAIKLGNSVRLFFFDMQAFVMPCPNDWKEEFQRVELIDYIPRRTFFMYVKHKNITEMKLLKYFSVFGKVAKCEMLRSFNDEFPSNIGFVSFYENVELVAALKKMNMAQIDGEKMIVGRLDTEVYHTMTNQRNYDPNKRKDKNIYVSNIDNSVDVTQLAEMFGKFGDIDSIIMHNRQVSHKCIAFINFSTAEAANKAMILQGELIGKKPIFLKFSIKK